MTFAVAFDALSFTALAANVFDLAPLHAGKIMGLAFTSGTLAVLAFPHAMASLTFYHSTSSEWQTLFYISAGIFAVGILIYAVFASGKRQNWAAFIKPSRLQVREATCHEATC